MLRGNAGTPVILLIDGVAGGALWAVALIKILRRGKAGKAARFLPILDCGERADAVMEGLREGLTDFLYDGPLPVARKLMGMAENCGGRLYRPARGGRLKPISD